MPKQTEDEFKLHFKEQLDFLIRSALAYDDGYESEAKRMAIVLRLLLHDTNSSTSLLTHLGKKDIQFYDTANDIIQDNPMPQAALVMTKIQFGIEGDRKYDAPLDEGPPSRYTKGKIPFNEWWNKKVIKDMKQRTLTRQKLVTDVCNKDGGAHIDEKLNQVYFDLTRNNSLGVKYTEGDYEEDIEGAELASIRQITHEVLNSLRDEFPEYSGIFVQYYNNLKSVFQ